MLDTSRLIVCAFRDGVDVLSHRQDGIGDHPQCIAAQVDEPNALIDLFPGVGNHAGDFARRFQ